MLDLVKGARVSPEPFADVRLTSFLAGCIPRLLVIDTPPPPADPDAVDVYYRQEDDEGHFTFKLNNDNVTELVAAFNLNWSHFSPDTCLSNTLGCDCRLSLNDFRSLRQIRKTGDSLQHHERRRRS